MYLNKIFVIGNLTRDVELKALPTGTKVANLSIATNRSWKDANGMKKEDVEFHNIVAFGKQAEVLAQYCTKGSQLLVEGRLQTRSWDATDGSKKYRTEIILENFQFGNKPLGSTAASVTTTAPAASVQNETLHDLDTIDYPEEDINLEDIPF